MVDLQTTVDLVDGVDLMFFDPPWGGLEYKDETLVKLELGNIRMAEIFDRCFTVWPNLQLISLKAPNNVDTSLLEDILGKNDGHMYKFVFQKITTIVITRPGSNSISDDQLKDLYGISHDNRSEFKIYRYDMANKRWISLNEIGKSQFVRMSRGRGRGRGKRDRGRGRGGRSGREWSEQRSSIQVVIPPLTGPQIQPSVVPGHSTQPIQYVIPLQRGRWRTRHRR